MASLKESLLKQKYPKNSSAVKDIVERIKVTKSEKVVAPRDSEKLRDNAFNVGEMARKARKANKPQEVIQRLLKRQMELNKKARSIEDLKKEK